MANALDQAELPASMRVSCGGDCRAHIPGVRWPGCAQAAGQPCPGHRQDGRVLHRRQPVLPAHARLPPRGGMCWPPRGRPASRPGAAHTVVSYSEDDLENLVFLHKVPALRALTGSASMGRLMPQVAPAKGEPVLVKQQASAFFGTDFTERLAGLGVDTVVITGVSTSGCVLATTVDAVARNMVAVVPEFRS